jgi:predicted metal-dependent HD superfamily phosphohydrolase
MTALSRERWSQLWRNASSQGDGAAWFEVLATRYAEPHRHYHKSQHIVECLAEFDYARHLASQPVALELAIWFHDAIYDTHAANNEEQSAVLAEQCLADAASGTDLRLAVRDLVLVTKNHDASKHTDASLLVDIDLSILGQPEDRFWEYELQVRQEYAWVPEDIFCARRAEILERFLARERIYTTTGFFQSHEKQARSNLRASLHRLRQLGSVGGTR